MNHLSDDTLLFYRFGTLETPQAAEAAEHLRTCNECSKRYAALGDAVGKLGAYDVEASADGARLSQALSEAISSRGQTPPQPAAEPARPPPRPAPREDEHDTQPPRRVEPAALVPEREPFDLLQWLGLKPGSWRPARLALSLLALVGLAYWGGGTAYYAARGAPLDTEVDAEESWPVGSQTLVRVSLHRGGQPVPGGEVKAELLTKGPKVLLFEGKTDDHGEVKVPVLVPTLEDDHPMLEITSRGHSEADVVTRALTLTHPYRVHLSTDKPLYQPGQTIHFRMLAMTAPNPHPATGQQLELEVFDSKGTRIVERKLTVSEFGVASYDLEVSDDIALGTWNASVKLGDAFANASVELARYTLPKFKIAITPVKESYLAGERFKAHVNARYFFGKPAAGAKLHALLLKSDGSVLAESSGKADATGNWELSGELPPELAAPGRPEPVLVQLDAEDSAGQHERAQRAVTVSRELLQVEVVPEAGLSSNWKTTFFAVTSSPDGAPIAADVQVTMSDRSTMKVRTGANGIGRFEVEPRVGGHLSLEVEDVKGHRLSKEFDFPAGASTELITTDRAFYRPGETVKVSVASSVPGRRWVQARASGHLLAQTEVDVALEPKNAELALPKEFSGGVELSMISAPVPQAVAVTLLHDDMPARGARGMPRPQPIYRPPAPVWGRATHRIVVADPSALKVKVIAGAESFKPGEPAKLRFEVTDGEGKPKAAAIGVAVVDESLFALAAARPAMVRAYFLVEQALLKDRFGTNVGELLSSGFSEETQMAGQLLLAIDLHAADVVETAPAFHESTALVKQAQRAAAEADFEGNASLVRVLLGLLVALALLGTLWLRASNVVLSVIAFNALVAAVVAGVPIGWACGVALVFGVLVLVRHYNRAGELPVGLLLLPAFSLLGLLLGATMVKSMSMPPMGTMAMSRPAPEPGPNMKGAMPPQVGKPQAMFDEIAKTEAPAKPSIHPAAEGAASHGRGDALEPPRREVRVRQHFPETLYVNPQLVTDEKGIAELTLPLADSITAWRVSALASSTDGKLGATDAPLKVFQPFFVDLEVPAALVKGDEATVPVAIYNYLDAPQRVRLEVKKESWFELLGERQRSVELEAGGVQGVSLRIRVLEPGQRLLTVRADGTDFSDAVQRPILVSPEGHADEVTVSGRLHAGQARKVALLVPKTATGRITLSVKLSPSMASAALDGIEGTLRQPTGCFEQTSSSTYPNALVLDYLRRQSKASPEVEATATRYLSLGYQRLVGFEVPGGGFEWFGRAPANQVLTAYGLMEFSDMAKLYPVDPQLIARTQRFLASRQGSDGGWEVDRQMISDGLFRSEHQGRLTVTAYLTWALAESGAPGQSVERAQKLLSDELDQISDPYTLALVTAGFARTQHPSLQKAASALMAKAIVEEKQVHFAAGTPTPYYGRGAAADVETTAVAAYALARAGLEPQKVPLMLEYILARRSGHGGWASTQATILSLKALLAAAEGKAPPSATLALNGGAAQTFVFDGVKAKVAVLDDALHPGSNVLELFSEGDAPFLATASFTTPWRSKGDDDKDMLALKVTYGAKKVDEGEVLPVEASLTYRGDEASGMVMVEVGVPAGLSPVMEDLEALRAAGRVAKYQLAAGQVRLYLDRIAPHGVVKLSLRFKAGTSVDTKGVGSVAYLYYEPAVRAVSPAIAIAVR